MFNDPKKIIFFVVAIIIATIVYVETREKKVQPKSVKTQPISKPKSESSPSQSFPETSQTDNTVEESKSDLPSEVQTSNESEVVSAPTIPRSEKELRYEAELESEAMKVTEPPKKLEFQQVKGVPWTNPFETPIPRN